MNIQDPEDLKQSAAVQDHIQLEQSAPGVFVASNKYDQQAILALRSDYNNLRQS